MGAEVQYYKVNCKESELEDRANDLREDARYEHGHGGYTGTIAEDNGRVKVTGFKAKTVREAEDYIDNNAKKWEDTLAVELEDEPDTYILGGVYSS